MDGHRRGQTKGNGSGGGGGNEGVGDEVERIVVNEGNEKILDPITKEPKDVFVETVFLLNHVTGKLDVKKIHAPVPQPVAPVDVVVKQCRDDLN